MNHLYRNLLLLCILSLGLFSSCQEPDAIVPADSEEIANSQQVSGGIAGFYLLNEGNFQANNSSLDYMNLVNGTYANENAHLLQDILRRDWGFDGAVVTDWGGSNDHALGVKRRKSVV